ncbi:ABC transporter substrate-binding protein [Paenibacillus sp. FSL R5-0527]|uniref:ABC transporter substrate-binding protein n=1 Tax=Paenibacillus TaxID=44249 RepID=UPI000979C3CE|nr:ABC transporter substrate-binding protein [Paenibacillus macerans]OMG50266.1 aliphatic sulfonate ABC transporter substrate-binding protein [Paenibacillus macerans]
MTRQKKRGLMKTGATLLLLTAMMFGVIACGNGNSAGGTTGGGGKSPANAAGSAQGSNGAAGSSAQNGAPVTVKTAYAPFIGGIGVYALDDKEFDLAHGVDVQIGAFGATSPLMSVMTGDVDIAFTTLQSYLISINALIEEGTDIADLPKIVYLHNASKGADGIVADKSIKTVSDLKGKSVTAQYGEVTHYMLAKALATAGLTVDDVKLVDMGPGKGGAAFVAGSVDAATTFEPYLSQGVSSRGGNVIISTADLENTILDVIVVSAKNAAEKPEWLQNTLKAVEDATQYVNSDLDDAAEVTADDLQVSAAEVKEMFPTVHLYTLADNHEGMDEGGWLYNTMKDVVYFYHSIGVIKNNFDVKQLVSTDFLW